MANHQKIQTLPPQLLKEKKHQDDYYPRMVSIGPNFHGKPELALVQSFKATAVELLIPEYKENNKLYHDKVLHQIIQKKNIRSYYERESTANYCDNCLAEMMLFDASLIILFMEISIHPRIHPSTWKHKYSTMKENVGLLTLAILPRDLFLLQNQIPLCVINFVMSLIYKLGEEKTLVARFLSTMFSRRTKLKISSPKQHNQEQQEPLHLLEACHKLIISGIDLPPPPDGIVETKKKLFYSFRTVRDLKAKGIRFKTSTTESLKDVTFKSYFFFATIRLPWWAVSTHTKALLKNLVAFELSPNSPADGEVLSYINLLKSLIDSADDVRELRERRILCNMLSSDDEAADVYNDVDTFGADNPELFARVKEQIHEHCETKVNTWIAELLHSYFRSPWTITAFVAADALLAISSAQLYYAVYPPPN